jgi:hypothetical protein
MKIQDSYRKKYIYLINLCIFQNRLQLFSNTINNKRKKFKKNNKL